MLLIVLLVLAIAKSPQRYLTGQCRLSNESHGNISRIDASKKTSLLLCPRSGDFEPSGHALRKSDNAYRASLTNDIKNLQILLDLHVNGFKSLVKCDAMMCP